MLRQEVKSMKRRQRRGQTWHNSYFCLHGVHVFNLLFLIFTLFEVTSRIAYNPTSKRFGPASCTLCLTPLVQLSTWFHSKCQQEWANFFLGCDVIGPPRIVPKAVCSVTSHYSPGPRIPRPAKDMSYNFSPEQQKLQWCEYVKREDRTRRKAHETWRKPYGTWLKPEDAGKEMTYFNNHKERVKYSEYDRLFHLDHHFEKKLHRDDRASRLGLDVGKEEKVKRVPACSSSVYGTRPLLEPPIRDYVKVESVNKGFYEARGPNVINMGN